MRITMHSGPVRKKPQAGDEKVVKGVTYIRQQEIVNDPLYGRCHLVSNGRPVYEWVVKGSTKDRRA